MQKNKVKGLLLIGIIGTFVFGSHLGVYLIRTFLSNQNIWWTPPSMQLSLAETQDNFQLNVRNTSLQKLVDQQKLYVAENGAKKALQREDIGIRLNNWERIQSMLLTYALVSAFALGVSLTCLVLSLTEMKRQRKTTS